MKDRGRLFRSGRIFFPRELNVCAVAWRQGTRWQDTSFTGKRIQIAYTPRLSKFNGLQQIELAVQDIKPLE